MSPSGEPPPGTVRRNVGGVEVVEVDTVRGDGVAARASWDDAGLSTQPLASEKA
jgi:hypothetical protein